MLFTANNFENGVRAKAVITSGMPITQCSWAIVDRNNAEAHRARLPKGQGRINGNSCSINELLSFDAIPDGSYYLVVDAKDVGGRNLSNTTNMVNENFSKFRVMRNNLEPAIQTL